MKTKENFVYHVRNVEYCFEIAKYLSDEIVVYHVLLIFKSNGVLEVLTRSDAIAYLRETWHPKVRTVFVFMQQSQRVDEALCKQVRLHIAPADLLFVALVILSSEILCDG